MKIGIYTDAHFSKSSSILTGSHGNNYSLRLDSLVKSFKWMYEEFDKKKVELILNLGDLISSDVLDAETNSALSEALSYSKGIRELWLIGNHEMKSKDSRFHSLSLIKRYDNIEIVEDQKSILIDNETLFKMLSFTSDQEKLNQFELDCLNSKEQETFVFTHQMYEGMVYGVNGGLSVESLSCNQNIKAIFNGHIHAVFDKGIYHQVGSLSGRSFGDSYQGGLPGILVFDTITKQIERIPNPFATLFYTIESGETEESLEKTVGSLPEEYQKLLRIRVPLDKRDLISSYLKDSDICKNHNVITYRINSYDNGVKVEKEEPINFRNVSIIDSLKTFVNKESTPYSQEEMIKFIDDYLIDKEDISNEA